jgi:transglutaminase-like putative cysteine protease
MSTTSPTDRLSPAASGAILCALGGLGLSLGSFILPGITGALIVAAQFIAFRLPAMSSFANGVRAIFTVWLLISAWIKFSGDSGDPPEVLMAYAVGQWAACEMALRCWQRDGFSGERLVLAVLLPALIMMGASNTFETAYIRVLAPLYLLLTALSFIERTPRAFDSNPVARRLATRSTILRTLALTLVLVCGLSSHMMVLAYRYEIGQLGAKLMGERSAAESVGLSTQPRLGATFGAGGSLSRVLRIEGLPANESYFRAMAFDTYADGAWLPGPDGRTYQDVKAVGLAPHGVVGGENRTARVHRLVDDAGLLFTPLHVSGVVAPSDAEMELARSGPLRSKDPAPEPFFYELTLSSNADYQGIFCEKPAPEELAKLLAIPDEIPLEVRLLAQTIAGVVTKPRAKVEAITNYLMSNHQYSLTTNPGQGDPTSNFLMSKNAAHCEYFASAAAILARCVGIPSRYVVGYYVHESDGPGVATVRLRDAHAWTECYIAGTGWITVDATPGGARPDALNEPVSFWLKLRERMQDVIMLVRNTLAHLAQQEPRKLAFLLGGAVAIYLLIRCFRRKRRVPREDSVYTSRSGELAALARRFEKWLKANGLPTTPGRTWMETLQSERGVLESNNLAREWLRQYNIARFGRNVPDNQIAKLRELLHRLEKEKLSRQPESHAKPTKSES